MKIRTYGVSRCDFTTAKPCINLCGKRIGAAAEGWSGLRPLRNEVKLWIAG